MHLDRSVSNRRLSRRLKTLQSKDAVPALFLLPQESTCYPYRFLGWIAYMICYLIPASFPGRRQKISLSLATLLFCFAGDVHCQTARPPGDPSPATTEKTAPAVQHYRIRRPLPSTPAAQTVTLVGAGDIAGCEDLAGAQATAKLIKQIPGTVFAAGDVVYERGTKEGFRDCYGPTWGQFKNRPRPALGNHEYITANAAPYFEYWGDQAGPAGKGYYSYDIGAWHIVVLNTNCKAPGVGGCGEGSPQEVWLKADLAPHAHGCILAY